MVKKEKTITPREWVENREKEIKERDEALQKIVYVLRQYNLCIEQNKEEIKKAEDELEHIMATIPSDVEYGYTGDLQWNRMDELREQIKTWEAIKRGNMEKYLKYIEQVEESLK